MSTNWVLLPGLARDARHWSEFKEKLKSACGGEVITPDLAGCGARCHEKSFTSVRDNLLDLRSKLKEELVSNIKYNFLGFSLGGMIALDWASLFPDDFEKFFAINTSASNVTPFYKRLSPFAAKIIARMALSDDLHFLERKVLELTTNLKEINTNLVDKNVTLAREYPMSRSNCVRQVYAGAKYSVSSEADISGKIVFLASKNDMFTDYNNSVKLSETIKAPLFIHNGAGHDLAFDDPDWVVEKISTI